MSPNLFRFSFFLFCACTSFFCAGQIAPSGGPPDLTPPAILETDPHDGQLFFGGDVISMRFNKYVDRTSFQQSCYVSPPLGRLTFDWSGKEVEVRFSEPLRDSTTYVFTVGTDLKDTRNNRLAMSFTLAFSSGGRVDSAMVSGKVVAPKPEGVMIYAYRLDGRNRDTLNPTHTTPDYLTQSGVNGVFSLQNLADGSYRLLAVRDQYKNLLYDPQGDEFGVPQADVSLLSTSRHVQGVQFRLAKEDTTSPYLVGAQAKDNRHVVLKFSEPMLLADITPSNIFIVDTSTGSPLPAIDFSCHPEEPIYGSALVAPQESLHTYRVMVRGARDLQGNVIRPGTEQTLFVASSLPDTLRANVSFEEPADSAARIGWDDTVKISFSKEVARRSFENACSLKDNAGTSLALRYLWVGSSYAMIVTKAPMKLGAWYTLRVRGDSIVDNSGSRFSDSVIVRRFRIIEEKLLGSLKGTVVDPRTDAKGKICVTATEIESKSLPHRELWITSPGPFEFRHLREGKYVLSAYRDSDGNGEYSHGRVFPFVPSERFVLSADTIKVRARWPVEGAALTIE